ISALSITREVISHETCSCMTTKKLVLVHGMLGSTVRGRSRNAALPTRAVRYAARGLFPNAAAWSPLPLASQEAGRAAMARKGQPWKLPDGFQADQYERARKAAAALIGAEPYDVALFSSVGYGVSTAGKVLPIKRGSRVIV